MYNRTVLCWDSLLEPDQRGSCSGGLLLSSLNNFFLFVVVDVLQTSLKLTNSSFRQRNFLATYANRITREGEKNILSVLFGVVLDGWSDGVIGKATAAILFCFLLLMTRLPSHFQKLSHSTVEFLKNALYQSVLVVIFFQSRVRVTLLKISKITTSSLVYVPGSKNI